MSNKGYSTIPITGGSSKENGPGPTCIENSSEQLILIDLVSIEHSALLNGDTGKAITFQGIEEYFISESTTTRLGNLVP